MDYGSRAHSSSTLSKFEAAATAALLFRSVVAGAAIAAAVANCAAACYFLDMAQLFTLPLSPPPACCCCY